MAEEFSHIYIFNLRGNINKKIQNKESDEGENIFGNASKTPVAISILVKNKKDNQKHKANIHYCDINNILGKHLKTADKLNCIAKYKSIENLTFDLIKPNKDYDWINQRDYSYLEFTAIADKKLKFKPLLQNEINIFEAFSMGISTSRDAWTYNFSKQEIEKNMSFMIENYNFEVSQKQRYSSYKPNMDATRINWSRALLKSFNKDLKFDFKKDGLVINSYYRPFTKCHLYLVKHFNEMLYQMPQIYPATQAKNIKILDCEAEFEAQAREFFKTYQYLPNLTILISDDNGQGGALMINSIADNGVFSHTQAFPLYYYEKIEADSKSEPSLPYTELANNSCDEKESVAIYRRKDAIRTEALDFVRGLYKDESISKEDIFYYIYALLNHKIYKEKYKDNLSKMLPRIPFAKDFNAFVKFGKELASLHLNYENYSDEAPCIVGEKSKIKDFKQDNLFYSKEQTKEFLESLSDEDYAISKMKYLIKGKKDVILFNEKIAISNIPLKAYKYVVNGRSAIEWVMERYATKKDKDSGIENNPNLYECTNGALSGLKGGKYALHLLLSVIAMSEKSVDLIKKISELSIENMKLE